MKQISIDRALADKHLLGATLGNLATWATWIAALKAAFGLELTEDEGQIFSEIAGGRKPPTQRIRSLWAVIGRRSGKSRMAAAISAYAALCIDHTGKLARVRLAIAYA